MATHSSDIISKITSVSAAEGKGGKMTSCLNLGIITALFSGKARTQHGIYIESLYRDTMPRRVALLPVLPEPPSPTSENRNSEPNTSAPKPNMRALYSTQNHKRSDRP